MPRTPSLRVDLDEALGSEWLSLLADWDRSSQTQRLFDRDPTLFTDSGEQQWLGWLDVSEREYLRLEELRHLQQKFEQAAFRHVLLLGMGGSSLGPEVQAGVLEPTPSRAEFGELIVLDSTDPGRIRDVEEAIDFETTLVIVSSKSGGTLETALLRDYFWCRFEEDSVAAKDRFFVITDPGSALQQWAEERAVPAVFGDPEIGGRYSVLSRFGLVPGAAIGMDLERWLDGAKTMASKCRGESAADNPGVALGLLLAAAVRCGRDKLMIVGSESVPGFGAWLEQLIAESTGKQGQMLLAIDGEELREPESYGQDRLFFAVGPPPADQPDLDGFAAGGQSVAAIQMTAPYQLAGEFYRWEIATAVLGAVLGLDPFTQPDVESAKVVTRGLVADLEQGRQLPRGRLLASIDSAELREPSSLEEAAETASRGEGNFEEVLKTHVDSVAEGGYFAILAYLNPNDRNLELLQQFRSRVARRIGHATSLGFGPRYLHSTGQAHKGGVPCGTFLVLTDSSERPLRLGPENPSSFQGVRDSQAHGDASVLAERGRPVLLAHLGPTDDGLRALLSALD